MRNKLIFEYKLSNTFCRFSVMILLLGLTACAGSSLKSTQPLGSTRTHTDSSCSSPTQYAQKALLWNDDARNEELERLSKSLSSSTGYCDVLELAIFLSTPSMHFQDDQKALLLLQKLHHDERLSELENNYIARLFPHIEQRQNLRYRVELLQKKNQRLK